MAVTVLIIMIRLMHKKYVTKIESAKYGYVFLSAYKSVLPSTFTDIVVNNS